MGIREEVRFENISRRFDVDFYSEPRNSSTSYLVSKRTTECDQLPDIACFYPSTRVNPQSEFIPQSVNELAFTSAVFSIHVLSIK
uniref:Uncharacterized protein n=1 Tax=Ditylenchus dipsaci TaxID=166011 RepID=A0A915E701_9BILA